MKKTDRDLGMNRRITRRDLIHDVAVATVGLSLPLGVGASDVSNIPEVEYYPPTRTGLRGSHPGAFESAHALAREGKPYPAPRHLDEAYDLVVVGAGISGLATAQYYRKKFGDDARILILENHDDFGGHAKRNEFHQGGQMRLALGGTHNLEHWKFSDTVNAMMRDLGIDVEKMRENQEFGYGKNGRNGSATWFDAATYGKDVLLTNCDLETGRLEELSQRVDDFPVSELSRQQLKKFYTLRANVFEAWDEAAIEHYLESTSYTDFLREYGGLGDEAIALFAGSTHGSMGMDARCLSVAEGLEEGLPGLHLLGQENSEDDWDYPVAMFPDGNASVARLQVHALIPDVAPGTSADNIAVAKFDYSQLDKAGAKVRVRLNSTVVNVVNTDAGVAVTYINDGESLSVTAGHCVLACYHAIIPHICPDLPEVQKNAQRRQVKIPLLLTNVMLRSSEAMDKLGINGARCPGRMHDQIFLFKGLNTGGYTHQLADNGPVPLTFWGTISPPDDVFELSDQLRASRARMLALTFEDYEREVRTVLDGMLGPAGFDVKNDVLAITVNRWPHGYAYEPMDLWDQDWYEGEAPNKIASRPFGNITMANSDAGASAYTHVAIDEAFRAVNELPPLD
jgi:spermidine dehydrogenase